MTTTPSFEDIKKALTNYEAKKAPDGVWEIELYLNTVADAVQTLVPVPLPYIDLDAGLVAYVTDQVEALPKDARVRLVLYLPEENIHAGDEERLQAVLNLYFELRVKRFKRDERAALDDVIRSLIWGFGFMLACQVLRWLLDFPDHPTITQTISEGLLVLGWVALWNPYDRFLFSWVPAIRKLKLVRRMRSIEVRLRPSRYAITRPQDRRQEPAETAAG